MEEITALRQHIFNSSKTRDIFRAYCQCKPKEKAKFAAAHQTELDRHQAAKAAFNALSEQKLPTVKELSAEFEKTEAAKRKAVCGIPRSERRTGKAAHCQGKSRTDSRPESA